MNTSHLRIEAMLAMAAREDDFLSLKWYVVLDDIVGGWAVSTIDKPLSEMDYRKNERHWIECAVKEHAQYIVDLHNREIGQ